MEKGNGGEKLGREKDKRLKGLLGQNLGKERTASVESKGSVKSVGSTGSVRSVGSGKSEEWYKRKREGTSEGLKGEEEGENSGRVNKKVQLMLS